MSPRFLTAALTLFLSSAPLLSAQGIVHVVDASNGPGADFTDLQAAIDAAGEGDTILLKDGFYPPSGQTFTPRVVSGKSLVIVGEGDPEIISPLVIENLGVGQRVVMRGVDVDFDHYTEGTIVQNNQGHVLIESAQLRGGKQQQFGPLVPTGPSVRVDASADGVFVRCQITGSTGLVADQSSLSMWDCSSYGAPMLGFSPAGSGVALLDDTHLHASGCELHGGGGGGVSLAAGAGPQGYTGTVTLHDTPLTSSSIGAGYGVNTIPGPYRGAITSPTLSAGNDLLEGFSGLPGDEVYLGFSLSSGDSVLVIGVPFVVVHKGTIPASGILVDAIPITVPPPISYPICFQAGLFDGQSFTLSSPSVSTFLP